MNSQVSGQHSHAIHILYLNNENKHEGTDIVLD